MIDQSMNIRIITKKDLIEANCFDYEKAIEVVEDAFIKYANGDVIFPDKTSVVFDQETQNRINCLPAGILSENVYGMKWVSVFPNNPKLHNKPNLSAVYLLSELTTGFPKAFMEGSLCSNMRTASVGAIAAKYLARKSSETLGFIGAGEQARSHFLALMKVLPNIKTCKISSRTSKTVNDFINTVSKYHPNVEFINCENNYEKAITDSDVIITAISGQEKLLKAKWIKKGAFYIHVAGLEDEFEVALKAKKIVCDNWEMVKHRTQTISQMYKAGILNDNDIYADLHKIITGHAKGRTNEEEFIYFNSVGMSFVDTALANWMYGQVVQNDLGNVIDMK